MDNFVATAIQMQAGQDTAVNLETAARLVAEAAAAGARLVALPEVFAWRGRQAEEAARAEPIPGPAADWAAGLAREHSVHLVAGSILERGAPDDRCWNTCCLFAPDGSLLGAYRKIHLFDIDIPERVTIRESATRAPGETAVCVETELGRIGLAVCYDLRFPELFRELADRGAEVVAMPSAFTRPTGQAHWEPLIRARAIENQVYFIAPNQFGAALQGFEDHGHSVIVDPWGRVLAEASGDREAVVTAALDADYLTRVRRELPCLSHRRPNA